MNIILFSVWLVWWVRILGNILAFVQLWYIKEYRFDRMLIHLGTAQGRRILFLPWKRTRISPKTVTLTGISVLLLFIFYRSLPWSPLYRLLAVDLVSFPVVGLVVFSLKAPTFLFHEWKIANAIRQLQTRKELTVIGITGSYGKTSTKEFLATILSSKFAVLKTLSSRNSPIGIAETLLDGLRPEHEVFIAEMGAYKRGEIARMASMVRPRIAVVTAINPQHQDLFRSIENTVKAKYELIEGLHHDGVAIFNYDDAHTRQMAERAQREGRRVFVYTKSGPADDFTDVYRAENIVAGRSHLRFDIRYKKQKIELTVPLLGAHHAGNILAAVAAAVATGMTFTQACEAARAIQPFDRTMQPVDGVNGSLFINDTFNNNPDAAKAAVDYLSSCDRKKILVFQPMIELGEYTEKSHEEFGAYAAKVCDMILLTNDNNMEAILRGVRQVHKKENVRVTTVQEAAEYIRRTVREADTVVFKGKEAERVLTALIR